MTTKSKTSLITEIDRNLRNLGPNVKDYAATVTAGLSGVKVDSLVALSRALYWMTEERRKIEAVNSTEFTPEAIRAYMKQVAKVVMPWGTDGGSPPAYERRTGDGRFVGRVDPRLGGYGESHQPRHHGWGYKGLDPRGQGRCTSGIVTVEWDESMTEEEIKAAEVVARNKAMKIVEDFLSKEFPGLTVLHDEIPTR